MKQLYRVDLISFAMAENEQEARIEIAGVDRYEEARAYLVAPAPLGDLIPKDWLNCIPWGSDDDRTVGEILARQRLTTGPAASATATRGT